MKTPVTDIIILAAGLGTRMKSDLPKVLHRACGQPMLSLLMEELDQRDRSALGRALQYRRSATAASRSLKGGCAAEGRAAMKAPVVFTVQDQQLGTGHAVKLALEQPTKPTSSRCSTATFRCSPPIVSRSSSMPMSRTKRRVASRHHDSPTPASTGGSSAKARTSWASSSIRMRAPAAAQDPRI